MFEEHDLSIKEIDEKIKEYIKETVLPLLLPYDATDYERVRMEKILTPVVSLDIYMKNLNDLYNETNKSKLISTDKMEKMLKYYLAKTTPKTDKKTYTLKGIDTSRYRFKYDFYSDMQDGSFSFKGQLLRYRIENYAKKIKNELTPKQIRELTKEYPHISRVEDIREILHNGGTMAEASKENVFYKSAEETVRKIRRVLKRKINECNKNPHDRENIFTPREMMFLQIDYLKAQTNFNFSFSISKYLMYSKNAHELQKLQDEKEEQRIRVETEKAQIKRALTLFDSCFPYVPMEEEKREEYFNKINSTIVREVCGKGNITRKQKLDYRRIFRARYNELMEQYENGTLPRELSFEPEIRKQVKKEKAELENKQKKEELKRGGEKVFWGTAFLLAVSMMLLSAEGQAEELDKNENTSNLLKNKIEEKEINEEKAVINDDFIEKQEIIVLSNLLYKNGIEEKIEKIIDETEKCRESLIQEYEGRNETSVPSVRRRRRRNIKAEKQNIDFDEI